MDVRMNHREFTTESKSTSDSIMRFYDMLADIFADQDSSITYLAALFEQHLIVFAKGHAEND
jgi:hypothetical protein